MIIGRGRLGGYQILDSLPLTEDGWAAAWKSLAAADTAAAERLRAVLAAPQLGRPGSQGTSGPKRSATPSLS